MDRDEDLDSSKRPSSSSSQNNAFTVELATDESRSRPFVSSDHCEGFFSSKANAERQYKHPETPRGKKRLQCSYCPYIGKDRTKVTRHERSHTGDKPYVCQVCLRGFGRSDLLYAHLNTHTLETPYECAVCGQRFRSSSALSDHKLKHLDPTECYHRCPECGKTFARRYHLKEHLVTHAGEKNHACGVCGRKYARSSALKKHEREAHGAGASD
ncbi:hypothetical protein HPB51_003977 [Rhipicephalus microplus]|uniref:C2H2-type domain-containing protein n=1 Tax=Rhipicephalus microplus TaxID=6941 RepID=A0A9J6DSE3_RHIMP|nr:gastrula zinc finger protein XlCGF9.1-like [Rhipicephalus microplus]KAH8025135.1 hypothetical protein HPB51_003977 [Rhipicephalus microplus]